MTEQVPDGPVSPATVDAESQPNLPMPALPQKSRWLTLSIGRKYSLGYTSHGPAPGFFVAKGTRKKLQHFPLTEEGWQSALSEFRKLEPAVGDDYVNLQRQRLLADPWNELLSRSDAVLMACTCLGGYGLAVNPAERYDVAFTAESVVFYQRQAAIVTVPTSAIVAADISGRGAVTEGGGFIGGGFGLEGAAVGVGVAAVLNSLTTKTRMETVLRLATTNGEVFLHYGSLPPDRLRIALSSFFGRLTRQLASAASSSDERSDDFAAQLERLADLRREGLLTEEEFANAKARVLGAGRTGDPNSPLQSGA